MRPLAGIRQIHKLQKFRDATTRCRPVQTFDGGEVLKKLDSVKVRVDAKVLRKIAQHGTKRVGILRNVSSIPKHAAFACSGDGSENAHERRLASSVGPEQAEDAGLHGEAEVAKSTMAAAILLADIFDNKVQ